MARTRGRMKKEVRESLPLDSNLLVHVFTSLSLNHGPIALETASAVCRRWHERVEGRSCVDEDPDNCIGELRSGDKPHRFDRPHDALFLPNGDVCVADCDNFRLQVVSRTGYYIREVPLDGGTSCPTGLAASGESLFVVEHGSHRVSKLRKSSSSGHRHASAGSWGSGDGELRHPWGVAVHQKRVYVTDQGNDRISVFSTDGLKFLFSFGQRGNQPGEFREPRGIDVHGSELYVADHRNHRIQVFNLAEATEGVCPFVRMIGSGESSTVGRFNGPSGGERWRRPFAHPKAPHPPVAPAHYAVSLARSPLSLLPFFPAPASFCARQSASSTISSTWPRSAASASKSCRWLACRSKPSKATAPSPGSASTRTTAARPAWRATTLSCSGPCCPPPQASVSSLPTERTSRVCSPRPRARHRQWMLRQLRRRRCPAARRRRSPPRARRDCPHGVRRELKGQPSCRRRDPLAPPAALLCCPCRCCFCGCC